MLAQTSAAARRVPFLFVLVASLALVLIGVLAIPQLIQAWRYDPADPANQAYYGIRMETRIEYTVLYLGLAVVLALMMQSVHAQLTGAPVG